MNCFIMKNPFRFFFFFFAFAMQTGGGRKVVAFSSFCWCLVFLLFFWLCSKSPLHARIHIWLVIISPLSLSLLSLFPHAPTKRLRLMDSGGHTGRVFSARGIDLLPFPSAVLHSTLSSNMSEHIESGWLEKEEKTNVCSLQTCDGLVRCFSFRIYRWHVDG